MRPAFFDDLTTVYAGDCRRVLPRLSPGGTVPHYPARRATKGARGGRRGPPPKKRGQTPQNPGPRGRPRGGPARGGGGGGGGPGHHTQRTPRPGSERHLVFEPASWRRQTVPPHRQPADPASRTRSGCRRPTRSKRAGATADRPHLSRRGDPRSAGRPPIPRPGAGATALLRRPAPRADTHQVAPRPAPHPTLDRTPTAWLAPAPLRRPELGAGGRHPRCHPWPGRPPLHDARPRGGRTLPALRPRSRRQRVLHVDCGRRPPPRRRGPLPLDGRGRVPPRVPPSWSSDHARWMGSVPDARRRRGVPPRVGPRDRVPQAARRRR